VDASRREGGVFRRTLRIEQAFRREGRFASRRPTGGMDAPHRDSLSASQNFGPGDSPSRLARVPLADRPSRLRERRRASSRPSGKKDASRRDGLPAGWLLRIEKGYRRDWIKFLLAAGPLDSVESFSPIGRLDTPRPSAVEGH
jgi:hypothetical protein